MIVSHRHKLIFTHIPKNAGTSIRQWFTDNVPDAESETGKHQTPHHVHTRHWDDYTYFAVVRNPYDRLLSQYHFHLERYNAYVQPKSKLARKQVFQDKYAELREGFGPWLEHPYPIADRQAKWYDYRWCPQSMWCNERTHVLKYERLDRDFRWVQEQVGVSAPLETLNTTNANTDHRLSANSVLLAPHRDLIKGHLMVDFKRFGYAPNFDRSGQDFK